MVKDAPCIVGLSDYVERPLSYGAQSESWLVSRQPDNCRGGSTDERIILNAVCLLNPPHISILSQPLF